jgi:hypothetical protein
VVAGPILKVSIMAWLWLEVLEPVVTVCLSLAVHGVNNNASDSDIRFVGLKYLRNGPMSRTQVPNTDTEEKNKIN